MSPERPEQDDFLEDEEQDEYEGQRSIFATGWFRAVLVLLVLAVIAVIAVPLIGGWFEPTPPPKVAAPKPSEPSSPLVPTPNPPTPAPTPPAAAQAPSAATPPTATPAPVAPTPAPAPPPATAVPVPPPAPAPSATPAPKATAKAPEKAKAPDRTAALAPSKSTEKAPAAGSGNYWVQVGAFKEGRNAEGLAKTLRSEGFPVHVTQVAREAPLHVVRVGGYPDRARASAAREDLQGKGHSGFVTSGPAK